jgi:hypothetical protein
MVRPAVSRRTPGSPAEVEAIWTGSFFTSVLRIEWKEAATRCNAKQEPG